MSRGGKKLRNILCCYFEPLVYVLFFVLSIRVPDFFFSSSILCINLIAMFLISKTFFFFSNFFWYMFFSILFGHNISLSLYVSEKIDYRDYRDLIKELFIFLCLLPHFWLFLPLKLNQEVLLKYLLISGHLLTFQ